MEQSTLTAVNTQTVPRFVFIHRIGVRGMSPQDVATYLTAIQQQLSNRSTNMALIEYFIPNREEGAADYQLTVVDLFNMTKLDA